MYRCVAQQQPSAAQNTFAGRWQPEPCVQPAAPTQLASDAAAAVLHHVSAQSACVLAARVRVTAPVHYTSKHVYCTLG